MKWLHTYLPFLTTKTKGANLFNRKISFPGRSKTTGKIRTNVRKVDTLSLTEDLLYFPLVGKKIHGINKLKEIYMLNRDPG